MTGDISEVSGGVHHHGKRLDGADSTAYRAVSSGVNCDQTAPNDCPTGGTLATLTIDAPAAGIVTINYQVTMLELDSGQVTVQAWANADNSCDWFLIPLDRDLSRFCR